MIVDLSQSKIILELLPPTEGKWIEKLKVGFAMPCESKEKVSKAD
jgi:hypothetical protein